MAYANQPFHFFVLFFLYGVYAAATEGVSKAWITNISAREETATAIGTYVAFQSICSMLASSIAGLLWFKFGAMFVFFASSLAAVIIAFYFMFTKFSTR
jgi:MFS family permease